MYDLLDRLLDHDDSVNDRKIKHYIYILQQIQVLGPLQHILIKNNIIECMLHYI